MRFLLINKSTTAASRAAASAARDAHNKLKLLSKNNALNDAITEHAVNNNITSKAWGQHCSPDCGCVLRFELELSNNNNLSPVLLSTTETVATATYHAKRVMVTKAKHSAVNDENTTSSSSSSSSPPSSKSTLRPLLTSEHSSKPQRPILTSCNCTTLHELAQQVVNYLPGRTLQQLRNETELGVVGTRSSMAFRHTVLRENVLPALSEKKGRSSWKKFGEISSTEQQQQQQQQQQQSEERNNNSSGGGILEMNTTQRYGHCFDLVEDSFLSMIHERAMPRRKDDKIHAFSPTMGGYFRMYSPSGRQQKHRRHVPSHHSLDEDDIAAGHTASRRNGSFATQGGNWLQQQTSPSSYFLFGDESSNSKSSYSDGMLSLFVDYAKEVLFGNDDNNAATATAAAGGPVMVENTSRPSNYLQLLDMYGNTHSDHGEEKEDEPYDDWLDYVDMQSQGQS